MSSRPLRSQERLQQLELLRRERDRARRGRGPRGGRRPARPGRRVRTSTSAGSLDHARRGAGARARARPARAWRTASSRSRRRPARARRPCRPRASFAVRIMIGTVDSWPDDPAHVQARELRQHQVQEHERRPASSRNRSIARSPSAATVHLEPLALQGVLDAVGERRLVLHDQDRGAATVGVTVVVVGGVGELPELPGEQEAHLLADVHGVVAHPLELRARRRSSGSPHSSARGIVRQLHHFQVHPAVQPVHGVVHLGQLQAQLEVAPRERLHRRADHPATRRRPSPRAATG